ncbi:TolC family protein [Cytophaga hutchinsonii]|jgi:cobalt-zinc-cadmium efflux system outer membrane protein|uniref:Outer membrane protein cation efflux protein n=1 Tax=Cytophaga hutchinsonii (strain ATCC 33406 / DSM 1761 / CIP 103989 / NBRC 15051 / NCIMB 9469 / D465) TaxID=269798 RepID=A0A6N4SPD1_CYTH3|nr:TolC family protein [Cytophaga hutchinsonii]ABG58115.1 outer membrane protein; cation efflux protein [Cytophaga hutchinsonii ATCC 33406]SFX13858.1 outer membrane protein, cobalt-zinc-cadmium efflux system [Cytophaga hutchinsonii ATCC 33406]
MKRKIILCVHVFIACTTALFAGSLTPADTVELSVTEAENNFIKRNLLLLATNYDIESSKAQIIQAKLWPNPTVELQQGIYDPNTKKVFDASGTGQSSVEVSQLINIAGARNKNVTLQKINSELAEAQLYDLLRTLKFELRSTAYDLYYKQQSLKMYETQITSLKQTVALYEAQYQRGNVPSREVIRLQAFLISLENEKYSIMRSVHEHLQYLYILTADTIRPYYKIVLPEGYAESFANETYAVDSLFETAMENRSDVRIKQLEVNQTRQMHVLEKANAYPGLHVGGIWDRQSNYIRNYTGVVVGFDLPVFNRNQGNIKIAQNNYEKSLVNLQYAEQNVMSEVLTAYRQVSDYNTLYRNKDNNLIEEFDKMIVGFIVNYQKRNITLIEFIDFYETYKNYINSVYELRGNRLQAIEYLNFTTGVDVYEFK